jgi:RNA-directed DNA polymerase
MRLVKHSETPIKRHIKVQSVRSPFDGDWIYWSSRMGSNPGVTTRVATLLKKQKGKCAQCGLFFKDGDLLEVDHITPQSLGGLDRYTNLQLLHRHCHDVKTANDNLAGGVHGKHQITEEPCDGQTIKHGFEDESDW